MHNDTVSKTKTYTQSSVLTMVMLPHDASQDSSDIRDFDIAGQFHIRNLNPVLYCV